jgi:malate permease and related proteins
VPYNEFGASVLNNIILLFVCLLVGMLLRVTHRIPDNTHNALNAFIIHISLPALIVLQIHNVTLHAELLLSVAMPWVMFLLGVGFFWMLSARLELSRGTTGALMLAGGLANTSFVGLPMIEAFFGAPSMATGILIDQLGTYLVLSTLGIAVAAIYSSGSNSMVAVLKRIAVFPPLLALIVAFGLMPFEFPGYVTDALKRLGDTLAPLALVSVGLQLRFDQTRGIKTALALGLAFKLLLAPAALALLYFSFARTGDDVARVTLFEAAMGPQIGGAIVAIQHGLNPPLVSLMVGVGITLSFITLPLWSQLLHQL